MISKTFGVVSIDKMVDIIGNYINENSDVYHIAIGTDSQNHDMTKVVIVVAILREGKGGFFFYDIQNVKKISNVRQKIYFETSLSLELASVVSQKFAEENIQQDIEIHCDIGTNKKGKTYELVKEITGWVMGEGFKPAIKPYSFAASTIADRISK